MATSSPLFQNTRLQSTLPSSYNAVLFYNAQYQLQRNIGQMRAWRRTFYDKNIACTITYIWFSYFWIMKMRDGEK